MNAPTDTSEKGLEDLIVRSLVEEAGYEQGANADYDRARALDTAKLFRFLAETQPEELAKVGADAPGSARDKLLDRIQAEVARRGVVDVLRKGVKAYPGSFFLYAPLPSAKNEAARALFGKNIFSVTRQLRYSGDATRLALDLCLFVNGLPVVTCELKNRFTGQDVRDAVDQYRRDRDPAEQLFAFKRCMAHFAVDDARAMFCTRLAKKDSWFLPFDKGRDGGAGNPPNPSGTMTDYLWKDIFRKESLADIVENYAQVVEEADPTTGRKRQKQIFPRYHQLDVVRRLLADVKARGVGTRYLVQHSAGSGKSNSIAWLAHQLVGLERMAHPNGGRFVGGRFVETSLPDASGRDAPTARPQGDGRIVDASLPKFRPFHVYSMKQAIEEGFILDVLRNYTPWKSYYQLVKTVADDPSFDIEWTDADNVRAQIRRLPEMVMKDERFCNAWANADETNARLECDRALGDAVNATMKDGLELFKQFADNEDFRRFLQETVFRASYRLFVDKRKSSYTYPEFENEELFAAEGK